MNITERIGHCEYCEEQAEYLVLKHNFFSLEWHWLCNMCRLDKKLMEGK